mmetsp:Transcript_116864/g.268162  ORF Transcript_116864/g.268162 Transcript_116864/m.268162 type:complete len:201 (+) Transcript_116864:186-788(+)
MLTSMVIRPFYIVSKHDLEKLCDLSYSAALGFWNKVVCEPVEESSCAHENQESPHREDLQEDGEAEGNEPVGHPVDKDADGHGGVPGIEGEDLGNDKPGDAPGAVGKVADHPRQGHNAQGVHAGQGLLHHEAEGDQHVRDEHAHPAGHEQGATASDVHVLDSPDGDQHVQEAQESGGQLRVGDVRLDKNSGRVVEHCVDS